MTKSAEMRYILCFMMSVIPGFIVLGQNPREIKEGKISYITTQNVYVKFQSTENIQSGDTLYVRKDGHLLPSLIVKEISSISCVCIPVSGEKLSVGDQVLARQKGLSPENPQVPAEVKSQVVAAKTDTAAIKKEQPVKLKQKITGNFSVASYLNFSNVAANSQRMNYTFAMVAQNIGNSKLSADVYITFAHQLNAWNVIKSNIFNGLKIYSLALNYDFNSHNTIWVGRKINPRISNAGALDGLQYELRTGTFTFGLIGGTRPDYRDYSFNTNLVQVGAYVGHDLAKKSGTMQTTLAFIEQTNNGQTDRRFAYLQYTNSLLRNLFFFGSAEVDLYKKTMNPLDTAVSRDTTYKKDNSPHLSNIYLSLRYRPFRQLSLSLSYSNRQNVIYYETYKSLVERLLEAATVQGYTLQVSYQPAKLLSVGINAGYRDSKSDPRPSKNLYCYITGSRIPGIMVTATISATFLETGYMSGKIYSAGISRDLVPGNLYGGLDYRYVIYKFYNGEAMPAQQMGEVNITWRIMKKLSCGFYYEGTFEKTSTFNRVYINLTQRF